MVEQNSDLETNAHIREFAHKIKLIDNKSGHFQSLRSECMSWVYLINHAGMIHFPLAKKSIDGS